MGKRLTKREKEKEAFIGVVRREGGLYILAKNEDVIAVMKGRRMQFIERADGLAVADTVYMKLRALVQDFYGERVCRETHFACTSNNKRHELPWGEVLLVSEPLQMKLVTTF